MKKIQWILLIVACVLAYGIVGKMTMDDQVLVANNATVNK